MKITFTKDHFNRLKELISEMLFDNMTIPTSLGGYLNAVELLHTTTPNSLNTIRLSLSNKINNLENQDEWVQDSTTQQKLELLKKQKELVNLTIGYKRFKSYIAEFESKKAQLRADIAAMKEEQKTPAERLKEAEEALKALEEPNF